MKKTIYYMTVLLALLMTAMACKDDATALSTKEIQLGAKVSQLTKTRAATYEHLYTGAICWVWADNTDGGTVTEADYLKAWQLTANANGSMTPDPTDKKLWPGSGELNFYALVGNFAENTFVGNTTSFPTEAITHTIAADQTTEENYNQSDLMYGTLTEVTSDEYPMIQFQHMLTQVQVALIAGGSITQAQLATATVELLDMPTAVSFTISKSAAPAITAGAETNDVQINTVTNIYGSNYNYATAIVAPHSVDGHFVKVTYDSKEYYYDITKELLSGHTYKLNLMLKDKALVAIEGNEINGWTALPHNTLTLSQEETEVVLQSSIAVTVDENTSGGTISVISADPEIATVAVENNNTINITGVAAGTTNITVTAAATNEYKVTKKNIAVTVRKKTNIITLSDTQIEIPSGSQTTVTVTGNLSGTYWSTSSNNTAIVTASRNSNKVTISGITAGTATVSVTAPANSTYDSATETITVTVIPSEPPFTIEAIESGSIVITNPLTKTFYWSVNGGSLTSKYTSSISINVNAGDVVSFYATYNTLATSDNQTKINCTGNCYIYGNIMSLVSRYNYTLETALKDSYTFYGLFKNNTHLRNHPTKELLLPATTLRTSCYKEMFYGCTGLTRTPALPAETLVGFCYSGMFTNCTGLTTAPTLPATTLATYCYQNMFSGCTSLASAPALPVEALQSYCYAYMFKGCTSLTSAPVLPAPTLANYCYYGMFNGCTNLNYVKCLATDISATSCTNSWLNNVASEGTFVKAASMENWTTGTSGIPEGWTINDANE